MYDFKNLVKYTTYYNTVRKDRFTQNSKEKQAAISHIKIFYPNH